MVKKRTYSMRRPSLAFQFASKTIYIFRHYGLNCYFCGRKGPKPFYNYNPYGSKQNLYNDQA